MTLLLNTSSFMIIIRNGGKEGRGKGKGGKEGRDGLGNIMKGGLNLSFFVVSDNCCQPTLHLSILTFLKKIFYYRSTNSAAFCAIQLKPFKPPLPSKQLK